MNNAKFIALFASLALIPLVWGQSATNDPATTKESSLSLAVDLADGSRLMGVPGIASIPVQTAYAKLDIPMKQVRNITLEKDRELAVFEMTNGDRVKGAMILKTLDLQTAVGKVSLGVELIIRIDVRSGAIIQAGMMEGLLLYYSFDEGASSVTDISGHCDNGVIVGGTSFGKGVMGKSIVFDGVSGVVKINSSKIKDFGKTNFTVSAMINSPSPDRTMRIVAGGYKSDHNTFMFGFGAHPVWGSGTRMNVATAYGGGDASWLDQSSSALSYSADTWAHVIVVKEGSLFKFYFNSIFCGSAPSFAFGLNGDLSIGARQHFQNEWIEYFNGSIDELRIYGHALSEEEIKSLYQTYSQAIIR